MTLTYCQYLAGATAGPSFSSFSSSVALRPWRLVCSAHLGAVNKFTAQRGNYTQTFCIRPNGLWPMTNSAGHSGVSVPLRRLCSHSQRCNSAAVVGFHLRPDAEKLAPAVLLLAGLCAVEFLSLRETIKASASVHAARKRLDKFRGSSQNLKLSVCVC